MRPMITIGKIKLPEPMVIGPMTIALLIKTMESEMARR